MSSKRYVFSSPDSEPVYIECQEYVADGSMYADFEGDGIKGHVYRLESESGMTLADLAQIVRRLQEIECPDISAMTWSGLQRDGTIEEATDAD